MPIVQKLSAGKEISNTLNICGQVICYDYIRPQYEHWARTSFTGRNIYNKDE